MSGSLSKYPNELFSRWSTDLARSDRRAFTELYEVMHRTLLRYAWQLTGSAEAAQDIVQDVFLKLWQSRERLDKERSLKSLLYTMVRNQSLNHLRSLRQQRSLTPDLDPGQPSMPLDPAESVEESYLEHLLRKWISAMPARRREAFLLSRYHGFSHQEIAQTMGLNPRTVNIHIVYALKDLRMHLDQVYARAA